MTINTPNVRIRASYNPDTRLYHGLLKHYLGYTLVKDEHLPHGFNTRAEAIRNAQEAYKQLAR